MAQPQQLDAAQVFQFKTGEAGRRATEHEGAAAREAGQPAEGAGEAARRLPAVAPAGAPESAGVPHARMSRCVCCAMPVCCCTALSDMCGCQHMYTLHLVLLIVKLRLPTPSPALWGPAASHPLMPQQSHNAVPCRPAGSPRQARRSRRRRSGWRRSKGDAFMQELVQAASKLGLLAAEDDDSANPDGDVAGGPAALGEAAAPGQEAWQTTPLPQSVGAKRKRLPGAAGA